MKTNTKIGLGLAALGRPEYINIRTDNSIDKTKKTFKKNTFLVLDQAYKLGVRYFDTAPSYGKGEAFLNEWNAITNYRDVIIGTKWGYTYVANWELGYSGQHEIKEHSIEKLLEQWQISKQMLPTLKYYQVHSATFESGILEDEGVLNKLYDIKNKLGLKIGITTSGANQKEVIGAALKVKINGNSLFDSFQVTYNIFDQSTFSVLNSILESGKTVIIKEALANGRVFQNKKFPHYKASYKILEQLSQKYRVGIDAVALRFVIDSLKPTYVLSGASNIKQLEENLKSLSFKLTEEDLKCFTKMKIPTETYWEERRLLNWN